MNVHTVTCLVETGHGSARPTLASATLGDRVGGTKLGTVNNRDFRRDPSRRVLQQSRFSEGPIHSVSEKMSDIARARVEGEPSSRGALSCLAEGGGADEDVYRYECHIFF